MKILLASIIYLSLLQPHVLVDFSEKSSLSSWLIVNDVVMGGRSDSKMYIGKDGHAIFEGDVSLENNGGFASARYRFNKIDVRGYNTAEFRVKGDGKKYQFRVKSSRNERASYITYFETTGEWQTFRIPLSEMYPTWRGMRLDLPDYPGEVMEEITFLVGNKKNESFKLEIDWIKLTREISI